jgi:hypothetical protein
MKTVSDVYDIAMDIMDETLASGEVSADDTETYEAKTPGILTQLQADILDDTNYFETYSLNFKLPAILSEAGSNFEVQEHDDEDVSITADGSVKAYHFQVSGQATIYIEDYTSSWNTLATVNVPSTVTELTRYKAIVTPTSGATQSRIRFSGSYYYTFANVAMFSQSFNSTTMIPNYGRYVQIDMPDDFSELLTVHEDNVRIGEYKWEKENTLYVSYNFDGQLRINYRPMPVTLTAMTDTLSVDDRTAILYLPYALAAMLKLNEDLTKADYFEQKAMEAYAKIMRRKPRAFDVIKDVYGGFDSY